MGDPLSSLPPTPSRGMIARARHRFVTDPGSARNAIVLIVFVDLAIVVFGGVIVWLLDRQEFEHLTEAFWYTLQTITTVGYGDVTPTEPVGRLVGAVIMLLGIAFLSILTATITSSFIDARQAERRARQDEQGRVDQARIEARFDDLVVRLDRIERGERQRESKGP